MAGRHGVCACALGALIAYGCGGESGNAGGADAGADAPTSVAKPLVIDVRGTAEVHPAAAAWMVARGLPLPSLDGVTLRVEEPFRTALQDPSGTLGQAPIDPAGAFWVEDVDTALLTRGGIAASLVDGRRSGVPSILSSTTVVFDVRLHDGLPQADITDAKVWALPVAFHEQLTAAVGPSRLPSLPSGQAVALIDAGFMLGRVVDSAGNPVAGAALETDPAIWADHIFYPSGDLGSVSQAGTSAAGLFVFVRGAASLEPFAFRVRDRPEYGWRNAAVRSGTALVVTVHPGTIAPR